jgi:hypothetical protein
MEKLSVVELKKLCRAKGLKGYSKMLKNELLYLLLHRTPKPPAFVLNDTRVVSNNTPVVNFNPDTHRVVVGYNMDTEMYMVQGVSLEGMFGATYDRNYQYDNEFVQGAWAVSEDNWDMARHYLSVLQNRVKTCPTLMHLTVMACRKYFYKTDLGKVGVLPNSLAKLV